MSEVVDADSFEVGEDSNWRAMVSLEVNDDDGYDEHAYDSDDSEPDLHEASTADSHQAGDDDVAIDAARGSLTDDMLAPILRRTTDVMLREEFDQISVAGSESSETSVLSETSKYVFEHYSELEVQEAELKQFDESDWR